MATRDEVVTVTAERYARATRGQLSLILDEFAAVTGFNRKRATRLLRADLRKRRGG